MRLITVRLNKRMVDIAEENKIIGKEQYGFQRGKKTEDAVFILSTLMQKAKRRGIPYALAFLDNSKVNILLP